jgi:hypothetical protein
MTTRLCLRAPWTRALPACLILSACQTAQRDGLPSSKSEAMVVDQPEPASERAAEIVASLRARFAAPVPAQTHDGSESLEAVVPPGTASAFVARAGGLIARYGEGTATTPAHTVFPRIASAPLHVEDTGSGVGADVSLAEARDAEAEVADGYVVYRGAHASGATMLQRALPTGTEDYLAFDHAPSNSAIDYHVALHEVAGLRLVGNALELLDGSGTPRLRVSPPIIVGGDNRQIEASLSVVGCAVDTSSAGPWGAAVTPPGRASCTLRVTWSNDDVVYPALLDPRWTTTGSMSVPRQDHSATTLPDGRVLVAGGTNGTMTFSSAEVYDRATGTWASTGSMAGARKLHSATLLGASTNGTTSDKVLVAGGKSGSSTLNTAQLYSPATGTWSAAGNLNTARAEHTATLLANGKVLVAGGVHGSMTLNSAAVYNPAVGSGSWSSVGNMATARKSHTATRLTTTNANLNNKVLVVGGSSGSSSLKSVQLFDGNGWSSPSSLSIARQDHTAIALANGKVLIAGGKSGSSTLDSALLFDPASSSGTWVAVGRMTSKRHGHSATLLSSTILADGQVLVAGGWNGSTMLASAELFNGVSTWVATSALAGPVKYHTANLLPNGRVLIAGGVNGSTPMNAAQVYDPSFGGTCTSNGQCSSGVCANGVCCNTPCSDECSACNLPGKIGTCSPKSAGAVCADDGNACTTDTCNGTSTVCQHAPGNAGATCRAAASQCDVAELCSGSSALCPADAKAIDGAGCSDNDACTSVDTCQAGVCVAGPQVPIDDNNVCTHDSCHPSTGVAHTPLAAGSSCGDANLCNGSETCDGAGSCAPGSPLDPNDGNPCTVDTCDPERGAQHDPTPGVICSPGNACTGAGTCDASGTCVAGMQVTCFAMDQCHLAGLCDPTTGLCSNPIKPDGPGCTGGVPTPPIVGVPPGNKGPRLPDYDPGTEGCGAGIERIGLSFDPNDEPFYQRVAYVDPDPSPGPNCRIDIQFCDDNNAPVARYTEEELNAPPPQSSSCPAVGQKDPATCGLDPATATIPCETTADCEVGQICGDVCESAACLEMRRVCASQWESCAGTPAVAEFCDPNPFRQCPDPRAVGTAPLAQARQDLPQLATAQPESQPTNEEKQKINGYLPIDTSVCAPDHYPTTNTEQARGQAHDGGSEQWGFEFLWNTDYHSKLTPKQLLGDGEFDVVGSLGAAAVATVMGYKITPLQALVSAGAANCGLSIGLDVKIFGDAVVVADLQRDRSPLAGATVGLPELSPFNGGLTTPDALKEGCGQAFEQRNKKAEDLRRGMWLARDVRRFYLENGTTEDLCTRTNRQIADPAKQFDCLDPNLVTNPDIPNMWIEDYNAKTEEFASFSEPDFIDKEKKVGGSVQLNLLPFRKRFDIVGHQWDQPLGPIVLTIAVDLFGAWQLGGGVQLAALYDGQRPVILAPPAVPQAPATGDVSVLAGPFITPGADIDVSAFAGIGIPGVSVGIEGTLTLFGAVLSGEARANLVRTSLDDPRNLEESYFNGPPVQNMPTDKVYHWDTGYKWGARLNLNELSGKIDLVARIRLLFFKKTYAYRLTEWEGFTQELFLLVGGSGAPLNENADYGTHADRIAHTGVSAISDGARPTTPNPLLPFPGKVGNEPCIPIPD